MERVDDADNLWIKPYPPEPDVDLDDPQRVLWREQFSAIKTHAVVPRVEYWQDFLHAELRAADEYIRRPPESRRFFKMADAELRDKGPMAGSNVNLVDGTRSANSGSPT
jgi:hypothetical protein